MDTTLSGTFRDTVLSLTGYHREILDSSIPDCSWKSVVPEQLTSRGKQETHALNCAIFNYLTDWRLVE